MFAASLLEWAMSKELQNGCRAIVNPTIQYCKYNDVEPNIRKSLQIYRIVPTTRGCMLSVAHAFLGGSKISGEIG
jgi:hypothetical protein